MYGPTAVTILLKYSLDDIFKVDLLGPLINLTMTRLSDVDRNGDDLDDVSIINLLCNLLRKYLYCQRNHGNQKKVFWRHFVITSL